MAEININGVVLEMDVLDADVVEKYENLNQSLLDKINDKSAYEGKSTSEGMKYQCRAVDRFFDKMFGEGTADALFGGDNNIGKRMDAFGQVVSTVNENVRTSFSDLREKYSPERIDKRQNQTYKNRPKHNNGKRRYYA